MKKQLPAMILLIGLLLFAQSAVAEAAYFSPEDLHGQKLLVTVGTVYDDFSQKLFPDCELVYANSALDMTLMLEKGEAEGFLYSDTLARELLKEHPKLAALPDAVGQYVASFCTQKNDAGRALADELNAYLAKIMADGQWEDMNERWEADGLTDYSLPDVSFGEKELRVACGSDIFPYVFRDENQNMTGLHIELVYRFCAEYGYTPVISDVPFSSGMAGLASGKYDLLAEKTVQTEERAESVCFTNPLGTGDVIMVVRAEDAGSTAVPSDVRTMARDADNADGTGDGLIRSLDDLSAKTVAVMTGAYPENIALEFFPQAPISYFNSIEESVISVVMGKTDFTIQNEEMSKEILQAYPSLVMLPLVITEADSCFATQKSDQGVALAAQFNAFLAKSKGNGTFEALNDKWLVKDPQVQELDEQVFTGENGTLRIVPTSLYPFGFYRNGDFVGFSVDLTNAFCAEYGYTPEYYDVALSAAIAGLATDKYDMFAGELKKTTEREEQVTFTDRLRVVPFYAIVRRSDVASALLAESESPTVPESWGTKGESAGFAAFWNDLCLSFEKNFIRENRWKMLLEGLWTTIKLALLSAVFGTLLGALICWLRKKKNPLARGFAAAYVKVFQGTPIVVLLLVLYYIVFGASNLSAFVVSVIGFSLDLSAYVSEMIRTGVDAVPVGQTRAALALGYGKKKAFFRIVLPQAIRHILPVYRGQLVSMVKMTSVAGYISVEDLTKVSDIIRSRTYEAFFPLISTAIIYFLLANLLTSALRAIRLEPKPTADRKLKGVKSRAA